MDDGKSEALSKRFVPKNTEKSTQWALCTYLSWRDRRNACFSEQPDLLTCTDPAALCKWLTFFVAEVRKKDSTEYPPAQTLPKLLFLYFCIMPVVPSLIQFQYDMAVNLKLCM